MKLRQRISARSGIVQHQTKAFYFVALKFAGVPDRHILIDYVLIKGLPKLVETVVSMLCNWNEKC
jgi:hypothetical protein